MHRRELITAGMLCTLLAPLGRTGRTAQPEIEVPRYAADYPDIDYAGPATHNRIWRLREALLSGAQTLQWKDSSGYLESLLAALQVDAESQTLVFSRTSLQADLVTPDRPRAVYFNSDTYVGYIPGAGHIELTAIDTRRGPVFYTLENVRGQGGVIRRFGGACLTCHDNYALMGGGVPRILALSLPVEAPAAGPVSLLGTDVDDRTPVADRWGGWYVTGPTGQGTHRGNRRPLEDAAHPALDERPGAMRQSMAGWIDTSRYPVPHSDVVALLVLEHQKTVHNLLARVAYKVPSGLQRLAAAAARRPGGDTSLAARQQQLLDTLLDPLVDALFHIDAAPLPPGLAAGNGFAAKFQARGARDAAGRSLHELQLRGRLFRWPLSHLVLTEAFDAMPAVVLDALRVRMAAVLDGRDPHRSPRIPVAERGMLRQLLAQLKPGFID